MCQWGSGKNFNFTHINRINVNYTRGIGPWTAGYLGALQMYGSMHKKFQWLHMSNYVYKTVGKVFGALMTTASETRTCKRNYFQKSEHMNL